MGSPERRPDEEPDVAGFTVFFPVRADAISPGLCGSRGALRLCRVRTSSIVPDDERPHVALASSRDNVPQRAPTCPAHRAVSVVAATSVKRTAARRHAVARLAEPAFTASLMPGIRLYAPDVHCIFFGNVLNAEYVAPVAAGSG
jgi:hypothetical protein